jgi:hypothetical protein
VCVCARVCACRFLYHVRWIFRVFNVAGTLFAYKTGILFHSDMVEPPIRHHYMQLPCLPCFLTRTVNYKTEFQYDCIYLILCCVYYKLVSLMKVKPRQNVVLFIFVLLYIGSDGQNPRSGWLKKNSCCLLGDQTPEIQPITSHITNWCIRVLGIT